MKKKEFHMLLIKEPDDDCWEYHSHTTNRTKVEADEKEILEARPETKIVTLPGAFDHERVFDLICQLNDDND